MRSQRGLLLGGGILLPGVILYLWIASRPPRDVGPAPPDAGDVAQDGARAARSPGATDGPASAAAPTQLPEAAPVVAVQGSAVLILVASDSGTGSPLAGREGAFTLRGDRALRPFTVQADEHGAFVLEGLEPGRYSIQSRVEGYVSDARDVDVQAPATQVDVPLSRGAAFEGDVVTTAGAPIPGATVRLSLLDARSPRAASARSGSGGELKLDGLAPGRYRLSALAEGFRRGTSTLDVPSADRARIVLLEDAGFEVVVMDPESAPVAQARVALLSRTEGIPAKGRSGVTDARGVVRLRGLPADPTARVPLEVACRGFPSARVEPDGAELERGTYTVVLQRGVEVSGRVVDEGGNPVAGAVVRIVRDPGPASKELRTTSSGEFRFKEVLPGPIDLVAASPAKGVGRLARREVSNDGAGGLDVVLVEGPLVIEGRVVDGAGSPLPLCPVALSGRGSRDAMMRSVSGEDGRFRFAGIAAGGDALFTLTAGGTRKLASTAVDVAPGGGELTMVVDAYGSVRGVVQSVGAESYSIRLVREGPDGDEDAGTHRFSARDAWFQLRDVRPGTYRLELEAGETRRSTLEGVLVEAGKETGPVEMRW